MEERKMKKALAIGLAAAMAVTMTAPVYASDDSESGAGIAKEDLKIGAIYIGDEKRRLYSCTYGWY